MATHFKGAVISENGFTGPVTGNTAGTHTGAVTGNVTGNLTGNVTGNVTGNSAGTHTGAVAGTTVTASTSATIGTGGTAMTLIKRGTIAVDPASCLNGAASETTLTITGAAVGDTIVMNPPTAGLTAGLGPIGCTVSATDTVKLRIANLSGGTVDEPSATWSYAIFRS